MAKKAINGQAAAQTLLTFKNITPNLCLYYVWQAFKRHGASSSVAAPTAYIGWQKSPGKHPGDRNPPAGAAVWWGPRKGSNAGDVTISVGGGKVAVTSVPGKPRSTGIMTIAAREKMIGRPYLGWTSYILDVPIQLGAVTPPNSTPSGVQKLTASQWKGIQSALNQEGARPKLVLDGIPGPKTIAAIKAFQAKYGLVVDGIWGPKTNTKHNQLSVARRPTLKRGVKNDYVSIVQRKLGLAVDKTFGPKTEAAVKAFQRKNGLAVDGVVGPKTWLKLGY